MGYFRINFANHPIRPVSLRECVTVNLTSGALLCGPETQDHDSLSIRHLTPTVPLRSPR